MSNEEIMHEFLLIFKGYKKGAKTYIIDTVRRDIVKDLKYNTDEIIEYFLNSGYFKLENNYAVSLTDEGFEYANRNWN